METINLTPIFVGIVTLVFSLVSAYFIPWLKTTIDANKLDKLITIAKMAVEAAEQMYRESGMGAKKKSYVEKYLADRGYKLDMNELDVVIESAVKELHIEESLS